ncbi:MAG TPA: zinc ribbon domain-containing protein [Ignavibacteria bacterium]|nr:zinc ribbon domain-containing protein [Ignavibacteria bacterium]
MPNYTYECENCQYSFEELQSMTAKKLQICPKCEQNKLVRLIGGGSGFILKGPGFYQNDYPK